MHEYVCLREREPLPSFQTTERESFCQLFEKIKRKKKQRERWGEREPLGRRNPPRANIRRRERAPPVCAMTMERPRPAIVLNKPPAICCIKNTTSSCLKNLHPNTKPKITLMLFFLLHKILSYSIPHLFIHFM